MEVLFPFLQHFSQAAYGPTASTNKAGQPVRGLGGEAVCKALIAPPCKYYDYECNTESDSERINSFGFW